jgi:hypothetical protein
MIASQLIRSLVPWLLALFAVGEFAEACDCLQSSLPGASTSDVPSNDFWM